jgi:hypothetical protein
MSSVRRQIFLAPTKSAWRVNWHNGFWQIKSNPFCGRFFGLVKPQRGHIWLV